MKNETLKVEGTNCAHLSAKVEKELGKLPGVVAKADSNANRVKVSYDESAVAMERLADAIEGAGYPVAG